MCLSRCQALLFVFSHLWVFQQQASAMRKTVSADELQAIVSEDELQDGLNDTARRPERYSGGTVSADELQQGLNDTGLVVEADGVHYTDAFHGDPKPHDVKAAIWNNPTIEEYYGQVTESRVEMMLMLALLSMACLPLWAFSNWYLESATNRKACSALRLSNDAFVVSSKLGSPAVNSKEETSPLDGFILFKRLAKWPCFFSGSMACKGERVERIKVEADKLIKAITMRSFLLSMPPLKYEFDDVDDIEGDGSDGENVEEQQAEESTKEAILDAENVTAVPTVEAVVVA